MVDKLLICDNYQQMVVNKWLKIMYFSFMSGTVFNMTDSVLIVAPDGD